VRLRFLVVFAILGGVLVAWLFGRDHGLVAIAYQGRLIETSVNVALVVLGLAALLCYGAARLVAHLWSLQRRLHGWAHTQKTGKARQDLVAGAIALAEGHWRQAEEALYRSAEISEAPFLHYLAAARAAQAQHGTRETEQGSGKLRAHERRDHYLDLARETTPKADLAVALTSAELHLEHGEIERARDVLQRLRSLHPAHPEVLRAALRFHVERGEWSEVLGLLPALNKRKALAAEEVSARQVEAHAGLLRAAEDHESLEKAWAQVPTPLRKRPPVLYAYASQLQRYGAGSRVISLIHKTLKSDWDSALCACYGTIDGGDTAAQIREAETWLAAHGQDPSLLLTLGRLCYKSGLWGKACYYFEASIARQPYPEAYWLLAETLDHIGDPDRAAESRRKGLDLATRLREAQAPAGRH